MRSPHQTGGFAPLNLRLIAVNSSSAKANAPPGQAGGERFTTAQRWLPCSRSHGIVSVGWFA